MSTTETDNILPRRVHEIVEGLGYVGLPPEVDRSVRDQMGIKLLALDDAIIRMVVIYEQENNIKQ